MQFLDLINEVKARGFDEVGDERIKQWLNRGYARICDRQVWPFCITSTSGAAPLTITDLRSVYAVRDSGQNLEWADIRDIRVLDPGEDATGAAICWYQSGEAIAVYPASGTTISVDYVQTPADLVADADEPVLPARYHLLIVDAAVCEAYKDSDNLEAWQILRGDVEEQITEMEAAVLIPNLDGAQVLTAGFDSSSDW